MNQEVIYTTPNKTISIYEKSYKNELCYCIEHHSSRHKEIISHNDGLLKSVIETMELVGALVCDKKQHKGRRILKFRGGNGKNSVSLRKYVYAYYHNMDVTDLNYKRIDLIDASDYKNNVVDMRKENLFLRGCFRPDWIDIIQRPNNPEEKYIVTHMDRYINIQNYTPELYYMLTDRSLCLHAPNKGSRQRISVHYTHSKRGYKLFNLSRFVYMYYKNTGCKEFINQVQNINQSIGRGNECGHVNAYNWNNSSCNLTIMKKETNHKMRDYIKLFSGRYSAFPIVVHENGKEIIILEIKSGSRYFYCKCCSPEDYLDLQKVLLGKADITAHVKMSIVSTSERLARQIPTPKEAVTNSDSLSTDIVNQFWKWCDDRDRLLNLYNTVPSLFVDWISCENNTSVQILLNQIVPVFLGGAVGKA